MSFSRCHLLLSCLHLLSLPPAPQLLPLGSSSPFHPSLTPALPLLSLRSLDSLFAKSSDHSAVLFLPPPCPTPSPWTSFLSHPVPENPQFAPGSPSLSPTVPSQILRDPLPPPVPSSAHFPSHWQALSDALLFSLSAEDPLFCIRPALPLQLRNHTSDCHPDLSL